MSQLSLSKFREHVKSYIWMDDGNIGACVSEKKKRLSSSEYDPMEKPAFVTSMQRNENGISESIRLNHRFRIDDIFRDAARDTIAQIGSNICNTHSFPSFFRLLTLQRWLLICPHLLSHHYTHTIRLYIYLCV